MCQFHRKIEVQLIWTAKWWRVDVDFVVHFSRSFSHLHKQQLKQYLKASHVFGTVFVPSIHGSTRVILPLLISAVYAIYGMLQYCGVNNFRNWFAFWTNTAVLMADPPDAVIFWPRSSCETGLPFFFSAFDTFSIALPETDIIESNYLIENHTQHWLEPVHVMFLVNIFCQLFGPTLLLIRWRVRLF